MQPLLNETKNKILSVLIVTLGAFFGFQAISTTLSLYQLNSGLYLSLYIYAFHLIWLTFMFDLHLKKRGVLANAKLNHTGVRMLWMALLERFEHLRNWHYFRHYQNYLVLPGIIYWGTVTLLLLNPFNIGLKQILVFSSTIAMAVAYWYMKEHVSRKLEHQDHWILVLSLVKLYGAYIIFASTVGVTFYFGFNAFFLSLSVLTLTFFLVYQALFQHRLLNFTIFFWILLIAVMMALVSFWVYSNWNSEYLTAGLVMLAVYNAAWGILHHRLDNTLTKKVAFEYLAMMVFIVTLVFAGHNFNQRIL
ncbi:MAG: hypothetical protein A3I07_02100 [Candidatus Doudnabacteria bacterium RIFCSPLOWO2_02_FULL_42_9]|uniref:Uncharacterized protein n=1 Tax=Candidatus Doudnabacteria bacterium RIFCSPHIGHO2_01_FULL_41_86 TaxID=1817821 RepID=A0A1F5N7V2_9BACT|nr:MAG: hypothetical protein A2717_03450 [Candidatus Doudnabacteria bacterium RIFCSPHIGHO2_01_FULL_41_86]OGE74733.1 MAG: hypothetical protein A3K07_03050 [Candidatus Doudnabacteria bacterium RIFCSPHIGHO2_01_43_10]OGE85699.1 MAG: hypothetical protein A3E28_02780 [Candidatus Doudnabacteria bacterium RIFCSPHIGHO2_12_FULL_42_22]OGE87194.1 MAG: hypothetical protein A3C49_00410 [Candidatus Doudnabacteria bacterium RIFCSPHIGHO2_02_FULL_42_25]OGE92032.1 MAG: hypothetical protein A2895_00285 [Candidatus